MALTADQSIARIDEMISEYEKGLAVQLEKPDVSKYLNAGGDDIKRMTAEDCSTAAITITRYSAFIQQNYNREFAKVNWAKNIIMKHVAPRIMQYSAPNAEERRSLAIQGDEFTLKVNQIQAMAQLRVDILTNLSYQIKALADKFEGAAQSKRRGI